MPRLIREPCDCAEWRRLNEACADLLRERDQLKKLIAEKDANLGKRVCQYTRCIQFSELQAERDALRELIEVHNNACHAACVWREENNDCSDYTSRGKTCPECPMNYIIDYPMRRPPMPDLAMCDDDICPYRKDCRRSPDSGTRPDTYRQSWSFFVKRQPGDKPEDCDGWWPVSTIRQCPDGYPSCRKAEATGKWCGGKCEADT